MYRQILYVTALASLIWMSCGEEKPANAANGTATENNQPAAPVYPPDTLLQFTDGASMVNLFAKYPNMPRIDLRSEAEFKKGHIVRAINWPYTGNEKDCMMRILSLNRKTPVMIYDYNTGNQVTVGREMEASGFERIYTFKGGLLNWINAGQTLVLN
jgi:rhodanese-related sulfurtransferase